MAYFKDIKRGIQTSINGLSLTLRHLRNATRRRSAVGVANDTYFDLQTGLVTLQYPHEQLPIPDTGRYRLHNEIDDCIVCDKCAKVCPVDCITIDAIKATEEVGRASDGSPIRLYAATFDIDMAKCCYCGLCTVVCPTECLTMDKKFDYSEFELDKLTYHYAELSPAEADEKRALYEQFVQEKEAQKAAATAAKQAAVAPTDPATPPTKRPAFRPTAKPATPAPADENSAGGAIDHPLTDATPTEMEQIAQGGLETTRKPTFQPRRPVPPAPVEPDALISDATAEAPAEATPAPKPAFRPSMKPASVAPPTDEPSADGKPVSAAPKPTGFRSSMKPMPADNAGPSATDAPTTPAESVKPKPAFRPTMKPAVSAEPAAESGSEVEPAATSVSKPAFQPTMKPKVPATEQTGTPELTTPADTTEAGSATTNDLQNLSAAEKSNEPKALPPTKPAGFRPTMKPTIPAASSLDSAADSAEERPAGEAQKPKPAFRPTMKPKPKPDAGE